MGFLSRILYGKQRDSAGEANQYLNRIPGTVKPYLEPHHEAGLIAGKRNEGHYAQMVDNPEARLEKILSSYEPSKGYQFKKEELGRELGNTAAAGGFAGTEYNENQRGKLINSLLGEDMQQYLENVRGIENTGLQGGELTANRGFAAGGDLANILGSTLGTQAGLAFNAAEGQNARKAALRQALIKLAASALGGGGGGFGGGGGGGGGEQGFSGPSAGTGQQALFGGARGGGSSGSWGRNALFGNKPGDPGWIG